MLRAPELNRPGAKSLDLAAWRQQTGRERRSLVFTSRVEFSPSDMTLRLSPPLPEFDAPRERAMTFDFFAEPRTAGSTSQAGPFTLENLKPEVLLRREPGL